MSKEKFILLAFIFAHCACVNGPCRQLRQPDLANQQMAATKAVPGAVVGNTAVDANPAQAKGAQVGDGKTHVGTVLIAKADGSLQCGVAKGLSAEEMEKKELSGLKVLSRDKRSDGMMHIQVCGSPTGMINVFEISSEDLLEAEKRGFKKFEPR